MGRQACTSNDYGSRVLIPTIWGTWTVPDIKTPVTRDSVYSIEMSAYQGEGNPMEVQFVAEWTLLQGCIGHNIYTVI
ncbi:MAG: hypothetical protein HY666_03165 [Chloroflexi bacterium]|nr:hypothetical protein [Chloroflexota bacterium]